MRTIRTKVYQFNELSEAAQQKAIEVCAYYNVDYEWWESVYEDAANVGIKLNGFDIDRNNSAQGILTEGAEYTADKILAEHGENCKTYKTAKEYQQDYDKLVEKYSDGKDKNRVAEKNEYDFDNEADELQEQFLKDLLSDYANMLQEEYEYLTSKAAIIETIQANEYEFKADGTRF